MSTGWIKLYRNITDWEWYNHTPTKVLYLHLLIKATSKSRYVYNQTIQQGQYITTIKKLSTELNLTTKQVRTALDNLQKSNNINIKTSNKYTLITIIGYDKWQTKGYTNGKQTDTQTANKKTTETSINNSKEQTSEQEQGQTNGKQTGIKKTNKGASIEQEERNKNNNICSCSCAENIYTPSFQEIQEYINNNNYTYNSEYFFNYYKARSWKVGRETIKTKEQLYAVMDNWQIRERNNEPPYARIDSTKNIFTDYDQKIYSEDEIEKILANKRAKKEGG